MSSVTHATDQGPRYYQEDRFFSKTLGDAVPHGWILAVMDGHGGSAVADLCSQEIGKLFPISIKPGEDVEQLLRHVVSQLNSKTRSFMEGSTLSIACVLEDRDEAVIAVLGDSPVIVIDDVGAVHVSPEHNVRSNSDERRAIEARGGRYRGEYIYDGGGEHGLQMSRALGDADLNRILSRAPDIYTIRRPRWVIVGSDGLLDPGHKDSQRRIDEVVSMCRRGATADDLIRHAKALCTQDNVTALVWQAKTRVGKRKKPGPRPKNKTLA